MRETRYRLQKILFELRLTFALSKAPTVSRGRDFLPSNIFWASQINCSVYVFVHPYDIMKKTEDNSEDNKDGLILGTK